jgi:hypothetical protein
MQQAGWQAILNNFKKYAEKAGKPGKMYFNVIINVHVEHVYQTLLSVEMDVNEQYRSYFEKTWPKALNKLKAICESR